MASTELSGKFQGLLMVTGNASEHFMIGNACSMHASLHAQCMQIMSHCLNKIACLVTRFWYPASNVGLQTVFRYDNYIVLFQCDFSLYIYICIPYKFYRLSISFL